MKVEDLILAFSASYHQLATSAGLVTATTQWWMIKSITTVVIKNLTQRTKSLWERVKHYTVAQQSDPSRPFCDLLHSPTDLKKSLNDLMWPRSTLKTPHNCSRARSFCCSSHRMPCDWLLLSEGAWLSKLEAELAEWFMDSSHSSLENK